MVLKVRMILLLMVMSLIGYSQMVVYQMPIAVPPVSGYIAWYDSKDESSIIKDGSNYISQWNDKSGNGYNLTQGTGANQPLYSATNGIVFDGVNDYMDKNFGLTYNNNFTFFYVYKIIGNSSSRYYLCSDITTGVNYNFQYTSPYLECQFPYMYFTKTLPMTKFNISSQLFSTNSIMYDDNTIKFNNGSATSNLLTGIIVGNPPSKTLPLNGYIKEIIIYNSALTTDQITTVNTYLNLKYGGIY